jgi:hypothetical protein
VELFSKCYRARGELLHAGRTTFDVPGHLQSFETLVSTILISHRDVPVDQKVIDNDLRGIRVVWKRLRRGTQRHCAACSNKQQREMGGSQQDAPSVTAGHVLAAIDRKLVVARNSAPFGS